MVDYDIFREKLMDKFWDSIFSFLMIISIVLFFCSSVVPAPDGKFYLWNGQVAVEGEDMG